MVNCLRETKIVFFVCGIDFIGITYCVQILDACFSPLKLKIILKIT